MTTTFRNALLALVLILGLAVEMKAQDSYEYATVVYAGNGLKSYLMYVTEPNLYRELNGKLTEGTTATNRSGINELLAEMSQKGWEVYNTVFTTTANELYYLKRKTK